MSRRPCISIRQEGWRDDFESAQDREWHPESARQHIPEQTQAARLRRCCVPQRVLAAPNEAGKL